MPDQSAFHPSKTHFDIVYVADFRKGDTDCTSAINAISALGSAGYRIGVLSFLGAIPTDAFAISPDLAPLLNQQVKLISPEASVKCTLLIAHDLRLFRQPASTVLRVLSQKRIALCRRGDLTSPQDLSEHLEHCKEALGGTVTIAPTAPPIRALLLSLDHKTQLTADDWHPTVVSKLDRSETSPNRRSLPTIGYFRSGLSREWPSEEDGLAAVLPSDPRVGLIGMDVPPIHCAKFLASEGPVSFVSNDHADSFFTGADFITTNSAAYHDPWPEEVLDALAHRVVPILVSDFHQMFFAGAIYVKHGNIVSKAISAWGNAAYKSDLQDAGQELIALCLAPEHLVYRVEALIGTPAAVAETTPAICRRERVILSVTSNGVGMGHLTRQIAIAKRLPEYVRPVFLSFSQAVSVVEDFGWVGEYLPYHATPKMDRAYWNNWLANALESACGFYDPAAIVLDSNLPFDGIGLLHERRPSVPLVWVRRAMWGEGRDLDAIERRPWFDAIFEPGEIAARYDRGPTLHDRESVHVVGPIHLLDPDELAPREAVLAELRLPQDATNVLLLPGAMNNQDTVEFWLKLIRILQERHNAHVTIGTWKIADGKVTWPDNVNVIEGYPFAKWFGGFDFAVSTAGYNSFAELTVLGLPTVFVPNENPLMDRQDLRALHASRNKYGLMLRNKSSSQEISRVLDEIADPVRRNEMRIKASQQVSQQARNGAIDVAQQIEILINSVRCLRELGR